MRTSVTNQSILESALFMMQQADKNNPINKLLLQRVSLLARYHEALQLLADYDKVQISITIPEWEERRRKILYE